MAHLASLSGCDTLNISPSNFIKFLGSYIESHLSFSTNLDSIVSKTNSRLFLLHQLKIVGMDKHDLDTFCCTNIRPVLAYAAPAWYFLLSKVNQERLERVQCHAKCIVLPDPNYLEMLEALELSTLSSCIYDISQNLFYKIVNNIKHPLHDRIKVNTNRTSSRKPTVFYPPRAKKQPNVPTPLFLILWRNNLRCILFTYLVVFYRLFLLQTFHFIFQILNALINNLKNLKNAFCFAVCLWWWDNAGIVKSWVE